jgi:chromosome segregation ATPase
MIDYEFTIRRLDKELTHYREMQQIQSSHMDAHDRSIEALQTIVERTERNLDTLTAEVTDIAAEVKEIAGAVKTLTTNMNMLMEALLREHKNGSGQ